MDASIGASPNEVIVWPVSRSKSASVSHCHTSPYSDIISAADPCAPDSSSPLASATAAATQAASATRSSCLAFLMKGSP